MKPNVGKIDKIIRIIIAVVIAVLGIIYKSWWGLSAAVPLLTALISWCPLYAPFKISTIAKPKIHKK